MTFLRITLFLISSLIISKLAFPSAEFFNTLASSDEMKPDMVLQSLNIKKNHSVADIGAGGGYYVYRFAKIATQGQVYAVDINNDYINYIKKSIKKKKLKNVIVIKGEENNPKLKENSVDLIFLRTVYHHIDNRISYFKKLQSALRKNARIAIIDNLPTDNPEDFITKYKHYSLKQTILNEMKAAGYLLKNEYTFIPNQSFFIFTKK